MKNLIAIFKFIYTAPLNKNHRLSAIKNFLLWQIATRMLKKKVIVPWVNDARFIAGRGETGLTGNLYAGFMEYEDMVFLLHALRPTMKFIDVGANIGAYTILASKVVGAKSIAFEPLPDTINRLRDQIQINHIEDQVQIKNCGVGNKNETLYFTNNNDTLNKVSISQDKKGTTEIKVITLDSEMPINEPFIIKIDVEGYEFNVLDGANKVLSSENLVAIIIELNGSGEEFGHTNQEIHKKLLSYKLIPVSYGPIDRKIIRLDGYNRGNGNTIYVKNIEQIESLCKNATFRIVRTAHNLKI